MGVQVISSYDQFKEVTGGDKIVVIDFWATWCGPCKMIGPVFEKISDTKAGETLGFYKVDVDEQSQIAQEVGIRAMPTFVFFKNGEKIETVVGADLTKLQVRTLVQARILTPERYPEARFCLDRTLVASISHSNCFRQYHGVSASTEAMT